MSAAPAIIIPAVTRHTATVIVCHGLGDTGAGWSFLANTWRNQHKFPYVSFILPNAPVIPITANMGMRMPGWYDIYNFSALTDRSEDEAGILRSREVLLRLIDDETTTKGIPAERIVLGGFSQGGAMSLLTGLTAPKKLAGVFGLSSYLLMPEKLRGLEPEARPNKDTKVFMGHGDADPLVRPEWGQASAAKLKELGFNVHLTMYPDLEHSAAPEEMADLEKYLNGVIPPLEGDAKPSSSSI